MSSSHKTFVKENRWFWGGGYRGISRCLERVTPSPRMCHDSRERRWNAGSSRRNQTITKGNAAWRERSHRRKHYLAERNHAQSAGSCRRYYAIKIVNRRHRSRELLTETTFAALLDRIATGTRASAEKEKVVSDIAVDGQAVCDILPSTCQLSVRNVPEWRAFGFCPGHGRLQRAFQEQGRWQKRGPRARYHDGDPTCMWYRS